MILLQLNKSRKLHISMKEVNYWDRLRKLELMYLQRRREQIIIIHIWKILNRIYPNTINLEFKLHSRSGSLKAIVKTLPKIRGRILTSFDASFIIKAANLWNTIPAELTHISSLDLFRNSLSKFLKGVPDEPPLPGYPYQCDNSLTNVHN